MATRQEPLFALASLRRWRCARFMTQDELAKAAELHRMTIVHIEHGGMAKLTTVKQLAEALEITPAQLCYEEPEQARVS